MKLFAKQIFFRLSSQDQILLVKRLGIMLKAGIPLLTALQMLKSQISSKATEMVIDDLIKGVENGQSLSSTLAKYKNHFGDFSLNVIRVGEISGRLHENLSYLSEEIKKKRDLRRKVIGALIYPIFIIFASLAITFLLTIYVFPKILPIFKSLKFPLPWTTRALIFFSYVFLNHWLIIFLTILSAIILSAILYSVPKVKFICHKIFLKVPVLGKIFTAYHITNFCRTLGILLQSDMRIVEAVNIASEATTNLAYRKEFSILSQTVFRGEKISVVLTSNSKMFPPTLAQMITVGEATGRLSESLLYLADVFEQEVDELVGNLTHLIEPVLMILMGFMVGFVAISIITPIYGITQNLHP